MFFVISSTAVTARVVEVRHMYILLNTLLLQLYYLSLALKRFSQAKKYFALVELCLMLNELCDSIGRFRCGNSFFLNYVKLGPVYV